MSIDINWDTLTGGPDGRALAESIRAFIHDRFQKVTLPRMIRSVQVHSFDFGTVPPIIELKDVCDPLPDFYEGDAESEGDTSGSPQGQSPTNMAATVQRLHGREEWLPTFNRTHHPPTPGILGGTSNLGYFHLPLSAGLSGTTTPLAAVAGAQFQTSRHNPGCDTARFNPSDHHRSTSFGSSTPPSIATPSSRPATRDQDWPEDPSEDFNLGNGHRSPGSSAHTAHVERSPEDVQTVFHIAYSGDIKLSLTAEILLDYPMPSFVGIPLKLNITGLTFDGVALLAYIKKKANFCFLCPEDAEALVGDNVDLSLAEETDATHAMRRKVGGLLEEIKVESEIGQKDNGKQVLKNVGKVEKFVLEQIRRIFEDEFVYPSFWTFLV
ncbi:Mitochondrial distribution and morphology protein 12 [Taxawa tesnikishii (nom. ined.)]|nr:Mitochondrial distribution and morphology protein 12 [Dothideales sp. JES 119]